MKLNEVSRGSGNAEVGTWFGTPSRASCRKVLARVAQAKETIFAESSGALRSQVRLLRLALNEAEAVARQTPYPHLVFPTLAMEKVQSVIAWNKRQQSLRDTDPDLVLAA
ncbi:MAG: hypothetical protein WAO02_06275 [Verrucomicrobiia bacterium]